MRKYKINSCSAQPSKNNNLSCPVRGRAGTRGFCRIQVQNWYLYFQGPVIRYQRQTIRYQVEIYQVQNWCLNFQAPIYQVPEPVPEFSGTIYQVPAPDYQVPGRNLSGTELVPEFTGTYLSGTRTSTWKSTCNFQANTEKNQVSQEQTAPTSTALLIRRCISKVTK